MNKTPQRDAFWSRVYEMAKKDRDIVLVSADMGAPSLDRIREDLPSQFVNVGIAEQNAITVGSGLAMSGKKVFTYAISPFITIRCLEQIRVENAMMKVPLTLVGVGVGFGYDDSGPTHHLIEDIAMLRCMPDIRIHTMTDSVMAAAFADITAASGTTDYVRLYRQDLPTLYGPGTDFTAGAEELAGGGETYIITSGSMTHIALKVSASLKKQGIKVGVIDAYTVPLNTGLLLKLTAKAKRLVTLEENFLPGGLGSAVCEMLADNGRLLPVKRLGLPLEKGYCYKYGGVDTIREFYGLGEASITRRIREFIND